MLRAHVKFSLRQFNNGLTLIVVGLAAYIIAVPFLPQATWWVRKDSPAQSLFHSTVLAVKPNDPIPDINELVVPSIDLRKQVFSGGLEQLSKGVLFRSLTAVPDKKSNTVLVGHRYTYQGPGVFYHLDKVRVGDVVTLYWNKVKYTYDVTRILVVPPSDGSVEEPTHQPQLTIYTCTPLWSFKDRLVVQAKLREVQP